MSQMGNNDNNTGMPQGKGPNFRKIRFNFTWIYILITVVVFAMFFSNRGANPQKKEWADVKEYALAGDIDKIVYIRNEYKGEVQIKKDSLQKYSALFGGHIPNKPPHILFLVSDKFDPETAFEEINSVLNEEGKPSVEVVMEQKRDMWGILNWFIFPLLILVLWFFMFRGFNKGAGAGGGPGGIFNVGKSTAKIAEKSLMKVTFNDVAGLAEAKVELNEIVDFLKNPKKYTELGGKIPKGALLVGPPGTGKTLLAKAVAGEADVPFFSMAGSDFVEMFVGVGASRVRDLFKQAKEKAPCIVFIDEIDAIGRARSKNGGFSGNDERENTLNQLLTEMDGFGTNSGVIILAATNRVDILDKALMRAGRFDRQITVDLPELADRVELFKVHTRKLKIASDFDPDFFAKQTPGFSGADIANICNEAALIAARKSRKAIEKQDFLDAIDRVVGGLERKSLVMTPEQKKATAYHEAGHAMVHWMLPKADTVLKVTIIPRGNSLGATWFLPDERHTRSKGELLDEMATLVAGRVGEQMFTGEISTGAANDLDRATSMAYNMIMVYGMGESVPNLSYYGLISNGNIGTKPFSDKTADEIDKEVRSMVDSAISRASGIIDSGKDNFVRLAELLYEKEVIFAEDIEAILGPKVKPLASEAADVAKDSPAENSPDENSPDEDAATEENNG
jgi:cell division protease FtsH